jgi:hypothetical protein
MVFTEVLTAGILQWAEAVPHLGVMLICQRQSHRPTLNLGHAVHVSF